MARRLTYEQILVIGVLSLALVFWLGGLACALEMSPKQAKEFSQQFPNGVVPIWALTQEAPEVGSEGPTTVSSLQDTSECPPFFELNVPVGTIALRFNSIRGVTELYDADNPADQMLRYDIDANLGYSTTVIPIPEGNPQLAADFDLDGNADLVVQYWDEMRIHSAPSWEMRASFTWPGYNVVMNPTLVELDGDPYAEIFATPNTLGLTGRIVVIDYDPVADTFVKIVDYVASEGAYGQPAVGDFDGDGRIEIIEGSNLGYHLYEWQESTLVDIGFVGDTNDGGSNSAVACHPLPNGKFHALLGYSLAGGGFDIYFWSQRETTPLRKSPISVTSAMHRAFIRVGRLTRIATGWMN